MIITAPVIKSINNCKHLGRGPVSFKFIYAQIIQYLSYYCKKCKYPYCGGRYPTKKGVVFYYSDLGKKKEVTDRPCSAQQLERN